MALARAVAADTLLDTVQGTFDLTDSELGRLMGVRRQAVAQWRDRGVPAARSEKMAAMASIADLLSHQLKDERIPGVARRPAEAYDGLSMLQMFERDRHLELLERVRRSFDWASTA